MIHVLPGDAMEDDAERRGLQVVVETEVELVAMDGHLERQQPQHHQMILQHRTYLQTKTGLRHNPKV